MIEKSFIERLVLECRVYMAVISKCSSVTRNPKERFLSIIPIFKLSFTSRSLTSSRSQPPSAPFQKSSSTTPRLTRLLSLHTRRCGRRFGSRPHYSPLYTSSLTWSLLAQVMAANVGQPQRTSTSSSCTTPHPIHPRHRHHFRATSTLQRPTALRYKLGSVSLSSRSNIRFALMNANARSSSFSGTSDAMLGIDRALEWAVDC